MYVDRLDQVIQFAVAVAGQSDEVFERELGPIHLIKYAYLADLAYAARHDGRTFTEAPWRFFHYGPWAAEVDDRIRPALSEIDAAERSVPSKYDRDFVRWSKADDALLTSLETSLPTDVGAAVKRYVRRFGRDTTELLHFVYSTAPMVRAAPNEVLLFDGLDGLALQGPTENKPRVPKRSREVQQRVAAKLAKKKADARARGNSPAPRYDDVFYSGLQWLDAEAGTALPDVGGELTFAADVWKSKTRGEPRD